MSPGYGNCVRTECSLEPALDPVGQRPARLLCPRQPRQQQRASDDEHGPGLTANGHVPQNNRRSASLPPRPSPPRAPPRSPPSASACHDHNRCGSWTGLSPSSPAHLSPPLTCRSSTRSHASQSRRRSCLSTPPAASLHNLAGQLYHGLPWPDGGRPHHDDSPARLAWGWRRSRWACTSTAPADPPGSDLHSQQHQAVPSRGVACVPCCVW